MSGAQRQSRFEQGDDLVVMKFGGTSVEDAAAIKRLINIVQSRRSAQAVVVVSALAKVTDQLLEAGTSAAKGHLGAALATVRNIYVRHENLADALVDAPAYGPLDRALRADFQELECLLRQLESYRELDLQSLDHLLGFGECFSSKLVSEALSHAGISSMQVDSRKCIVTDGRHGQAAPLWDLTNEHLRNTLEPLLSEGCVPVLGGFIASTADGVPTTLGRGGSDFSAAIVGAALSAARVEIWTDVDGVMTTDPRLCPDAHVIHKMSFDEASELAQLGAKVLHPATLVPAMRENIPVHVLNSRQPGRDGTEITAQARSVRSVSAITVKRNVTAVEIESHLGIDSTVLETVFSSFDRHSSSVEVMATSLGRISLLVASTAPLPKIAAELQGLAKVQWEDHRALVCIVGENIRRQPEVASQAFAAVSGMKIRALFQGASDRTISFLVEDSEVEESVRRLHNIFFPKPEPQRDWGGISAAFCQAG